MKSSRRTYIKSWPRAYSGQMVCLNREHVGTRAPGSRTFDKVGDKPNDTGVTLPSQRQPSVCAVCRQGRTRSVLRAPPLSERSSMLSCPAAT